MRQCMASEGCRHHCTSSAIQRLPGFQVQQAREECSPIPLLRVSTLSATFPLRESWHNGSHIVSSPCHPSKVELLQLHISDTAFAYHKATQTSLNPFLNSGRKLKLATSPSSRTLQAKRIDSTLSFWQYSDLTWIQNIRAEQFNSLSKLSLVPSPVVAPTKLHIAMGFLDKQEVPSSPEVCS